MAKIYKISNKIKTLRFFADQMSQMELAKLAGVSRQTIIAVEADKYPPSLELAFKLADIFGVGIHEVFECEVIEA